MTGNQIQKENAALVALLRTCRKPDTWHTIADKVQREQSALTLWNHQVDPEGYPLPDEDYQYEGATQDALFTTPEDRRDAEALRETLELEFGKATEDVETWKREGKRFVSVLDGEFPNSLRDIVDMPPFVFAKGKLVQDDVGISIVGSRKATTEAMNFAREAASMAVSEDLTVIAGLAEGIDAAAHAQALADKGRTVAFIGTGIDRYYPAKNRALQEAIEERGLVLSQFWPDTPPTRRTFPMRNALMSGYGIATVVVEANEHSGTRIQARQAQNHGRPVIIRREVAESTKWAKSLVGKPGIYVVDTVNELRDRINKIRSQENALESLLNSLFDSSEDPSWDSLDGRKDMGAQEGLARMGF